MKLQHGLAGARLRIGIPQRFEVAGGPGFEPRLTESESAVLPLNYPPTKFLKPLAFSGEVLDPGGRR